MDISNLLINEESTMLEAMELLDQVAKKVLFVTDKGRFVASITDGDIRRWILKKGNLDAKVKDIANYQPIYIEQKDKARSRHIMKKHLIEALPVVNKKKEITSVIFLNDKELSAKKGLKVPIVIMAGGFGTRLYPYTKILPKPLIPIGEIPIVEHIINRFYAYGNQEFFLIVNHKKNMIKSYFNELEIDYSVEYVDEDVPLGTGGGLSLLKGKIQDTFILTNCDIIIEEDFDKIYDYHKKEKNLITMVCSLKKMKIPYGVIEINDNGEIGDMKEKPIMSFFTNTGVYIVDACVINELEENKKMGFPDIINEYRAKGRKVGVYPISERSWMDMGQLDGMEKMRRRLCDE